MTPSRRALSEAALLGLLRDGQPLQLHRLARARHANLSGIGAAAIGGRWNKIGTEALYTSLEVSTPLLERLAHTSKDTIPSNLALMTIELSGQWRNVNRWTWIEESYGAPFFVHTTLSEASRAFEAGVINNGRPVALAVPSVVAPAWNVVLFPEHAAFWHLVRLCKVDPFHFDPRLFLPDATVEA